MNTQYTVIETSDPNTIGVPMDKAEAEALAHQWNYNTTGLHYAVIAYPYDMENRPLPVPAYGLKTRRNSYYGMNLDGTSDSEWFPREYGVMFQGALLQGQLTYYQATVYVNSILDETGQLCDVARVIDGIWSIVE